MNMMFSEHGHRSREIKEFIEKGGYDAYEMGAAIVDLCQRGPDGQRKIFGYNINHPIYPASVAKVFVGAEVIRRVRLGELDLREKIEVCSPDDVDTSLAIFNGDTRPLLHAGDIVTIDYLLDLMLSRSDNTATNVLIERVGRDAINMHVIERNGWQGSEVTRKYMPRADEGSMFRNAPSLQTCARHIAEFFATLADSTFSIRTMLAKYMGKYDHGDREGLWLPGSYHYYCCKGGKHSNRLRNGKTAHWLNDAGIVVGRKSCYAIAVLTVDKNDQASSTFPMRKLAETLFDYMESYKY